MTTPWRSETSATVYELQRRFPGVWIWYGAHTRRWWAGVMNVGLLHAETPAALSHALQGLAVQPRPPGR
jgi:hypothetical protein